MAITSPFAKDVRTVFHEELDPRQRSALLSWLAFTATFGAVRGITYSIKHGQGPFRNLSVGGAHLHHYMWGIGMVSGVGGTPGVPTLPFTGAHCSASAMASRTVSETPDRLPFSSRV